MVGAIALLSTSLETAAMASAEPSICAGFEVSGAISDREREEPHSRTRSAPPS
jgi:hypothetical protein